MQKQIFTFVLVAIALVFSLSVEAADLSSFSPRPPLNKVSYQTTVEKWATTKTANVTINVDAILDKIGLSNINAHVLETLHKMAATADWHVTQFNRTQDKSGLEMLHVEAEARLPQDILVSLREKAKNISKPGETYTIGDIDFSPALTEMEKAHAEARNVIYQQVKEEIARLNQIYPEQHYFLNQLDFGQSPVAPVMYKGARAEVNMTSAAPNVPNIPVNAKVTEMAQVVIAAKNPKNANEKIAQ